MYSIKSLCLSFLVASALTIWGHPVLSAGVLDFAVIQPGQPGTSRDAQPVMDALAAYIQKKTGIDGITQGAYFNQRGPALDFLRTQRPAWGIVRLGFYSAHARDFQMTPLASTRPGGSHKDVWRLMGSKTGPGQWKDLTGTVQGNMLFEKQAAACLLFDVPVIRLPFKLEGTFRPLRALRQVTRGRTAGVVLDRSQYEAVQALSLFRDITVLHTAPDLPTSPVVWFGRTDHRTRKLKAVLLKMKEDPDAQALLKLLQTDGFGPSDPDLSTLRLETKGVVCFP